MLETFKLILQGEGGTREIETIQFEPAETIKSLKSAIQDKFSIPTCCQKLYFESLQLRDSERLTAYRFRESDIIYVRYKAKADIQEVFNALGVLRELLHILKEVERTSDMVKFNVTLVSSLPVKVMTLNQLGERYFSKISTHQYHSNMALFMENEGVDMLCTAHHLLLEHDQPAVLVLESVFLLLWARLSLMRNCLDTNQLRDIASLLLQSLQRHDIIEANKASPNDTSRIKKDVILLSLRAISNLTASCADVRETIASSEGAMHQLNTVLSSTVSINSSTAVVGVLGTFENLSESESTHVYLSTSQTIKSLIGMCKHSNSDIMSANHFRLSVSRTLSTVVVSSAHVITLSDLLRINMFLRESVAMADIDAAHKFLHEQLSGWIGTLKGLANLAYYPYKNRGFSCIQSYYSEKHKRALWRLEQRCIEVGVMSLHLALLGKVEKQIIIKEGLVDYVVCLPWCLHQGSTAYHRACDIVTYLSGEMQLQPPSLLNLAKAKLASIHFGLKKMLNTFTMQDLL